MNKRRKRKVSVSLVVHNLKECVVSLLGNDRDLVPVICLMERKGKIRIK